jgi:hypothetical protein
MDQANLVAARKPFDVGGQRAAAFELLVNPGDEQEIAGPGLDCAGCREQQVGKGVTNAAEPQLVARVLFGEEGDNVGHLAAVILRKIDPREHRRHGVGPCF